MKRTLRLTYTHSSLDDELFRVHVVPAQYYRVIEWAERERTNYPLGKGGHLQDRAAALSALAILGIYIHPRLLEVIIKE
jgi:hypothetical protein